jgi:uncharacterized protein
MAILGWIIRILTVLVAVRVVLRLLGSLRSSGAPSQSAPKPGGPRVGGRLVRDPQCGTHLPETQALRLGMGAQTHYFCSADCRDQWLAARRAG